MGVISSSFTILFLLLYFFALSLHSSLFLSLFHHNCLSPLSIPWHLCFSCFEFLQFFLFSSSFSSYNLFVLYLFHYPFFSLYPFYGSLFFYINYIYMIIYVFMIVYVCFLVPLDFSSYLLSSLFTMHSRFLTLLFVDLFSLPCAFHF